MNNPEKVFWPEEQYTKGDLANYYTEVAPFILPYLKKRPIVLHRFPDGITGGEFYQKETPEKHPSWLKTIEVQHEERTIHYLEITDVRSLLYAINLGSIDLHPFLGHLPHLDLPDYCVLDLDPEALDFKAVVKVAQVIHTFLEDLKLPHFCKTTGGRGLHIFLPLHAHYSIEQSKQFAELLARTIHNKLPALTSLTRSPAKRQHKVYLDYLQNRSGQTVVAPYAVRPRPHAPVSTPLLWDEVQEGLDPLAFTIATVPKRLQKHGDLFKGIFGAGISIEKTLKAFDI